ncbi:hypothetical protein [Nonomuraea sp. B1E8]|uniref:hypothetical protein n=1 Tax=unclassified Nonomuraea TaxID=2593643 RepID=UPI00325D8D58
MLPLAHLADPDDAIAFPAFYALTAPAMRAAARKPLYRARHAGIPCHAPVGPGGCAECEATIEDLLLAGFARLRGPLPTTRTGEPVRELALVRYHLVSPQAEYEDTAALAHALRRPAVEGEPPWLRAARAQLIHYPLVHLEGRIRRDDAVRRGAAARPERDLQQAAWAAPLRTDPVTLDLLILAVCRARRGASCCEIPADLCERHGLSMSEARRRTDAALQRLRCLNPAFYAANLDDDPLAGISWAVGYTCSTHIVERDAARETLHRLLAAPGPTYRRAYQAVVASICAAGSGERADPVRLAMTSMGLTPPTAQRLIRTLVSLAAAAGLDWCAARCPNGSASDTTPAHRGHVRALPGLGQEELTLAPVLVG